MGDEQISRKVPAGLGPQRRDEAIRHLDGLAEALRCEGLAATPLYDADPPYLRIAFEQQGLVLLAENLSIAWEDADGSPKYYYRWSWGELLHPASDQRGAVEKICRVLRPCPGSSS